MKHNRCLVIRGRQAVHVLRSRLRPKELADVEKREKSALARSRFAALLRRVRNAEDVSRQATLGAEPKEVSDGRRASDRN
jgi:hypothetical protein